MESASVPISDIFFFSSSTNLFIVIFSLFQSLTDFTSSLKFPISSLYSFKYSR
ncbi:MAG: hypothetical protein LBC61_05610 [Candidatus Peribacteria bacterium]|nr:hypothetical protein [Candidatus Peribacteria bacterium]